jgi:hypothetical protein
VPNIDGLVWLGYLTHISEDISDEDDRLLELPRLAALDGERDFMVAKL